MNHTTPPSPEDTHHDLTTEERRIEDEEYAYQYLLWAIKNA